MLNSNLALDVTDEQFEKLHRIRLYTRIAVAILEVLANSRNEIDGIKASGVLIIVHEAHVATQSINQFTTKS